MWGRAGRRGRGLAVYVAGEDALDQFFCRHPDEFLERPVEAAILHHENEQIHLPHLLCAAHEGPIEPDDRRGDPRPARARALRGARRATASWSSAAGASRCARPRTTRRRACRCARARRRASQIVDAAQGELLGDVELARACTTVHDGAVYLHMGRQYEVRELDLDAGRALVEPFSGDWYTQPKREIDTSSSGCSTAARCCGVDAELRHGHRQRAGARLPAQAARHARGARPRGARPAAHRVHDAGALVRARARRARRPAARGRCSARCTRPSTRRSRCCRCWRCATAGTSAASRRTCTRRPAGPTIFIYDGHPGGVGITRQGFTALRAARAATRSG